jgi:quercetin dioxygenase-like cupin family protein
MDATILDAGEGERLDAEHRIKLASPQLDVVEFTVGADYEGPGLHYHERHVDSFYVLEGELEFRAGPNTLRAGPGTSVAVPPGIVHSFTNPGPQGDHFLNVHAPGGFAEYLRARFPGDEPDPADFDIHDLDAPEGTASAIVAAAENGERFQPPNLTITIRADRPELSLLELAPDAGWSGVEPHHHDDHVDSFFVLAGEVDFLAGDEWVRAHAGSFVSMPIGVTHAIGRAGAPARFLNLHTPDAGFAGRVRGRS